MTINLFVWLCGWLTIFRSVTRSGCLAFWLSVCLSGCLSVVLYARLSLWTTGCLLVSLAAFQSVDNYEDEIPTQYKPQLHYENDYSSKFVPLVVTTT